jgi:SIT4 phosphatase-associated protein
VGPITPLTVERFRICELYAELLHCSNMALLNRAPGIGPTYDEDGRLLGGLSALEELARVISSGSGANHTSEEVNGDAQEMVEAKELPVHSTSARSNDSSSLASDSDSDLSDHSSDEALEEIAVTNSHDLPFPVRSSSQEQLPPPVSLPSDAPLLPAPPDVTLNAIDYSSNASPGEPSVRPKGDWRDGNDSASAIPVGDTLKQRFMDMDVVPTLLVSLDDLYESCHIYTVSTGLFLPISMEQLSAWCCV